ncbi:hypothetical protein NA56DRAFT_644816 [Hyaloscypha hepaticicola]|uniref:Uncharacterized protein n=1 Tax=Hyaloscypha hepaticicola TaxID=2082293 RepID=A0A2J6Q8L9_9HELO|nr:hypothetical protein NA56DRAFT_644816 [Hyaloscypha hepaticicola]
MSLDLTLFLNASCTDPNFSEVTCNALSENSRFLSSFFFASIAFVEPNASEVEEEEGGRVGMDMLSLQCIWNDIASGAMPCVPHAEVCCLRRSQANALNNPQRLFIDLHDHPSLLQGSPDGHLSLHAHPPIERAAESLFGLFGEAPPCTLSSHFHYYSSTTSSNPPSRARLQAIAPILRNIFQIRYSK